MKKAIVTGSTGFIGKNLVNELIQNNVEVIAVDRKGANWGSLSDKAISVECDLSEISHLPEMISDRDIDCIFHLAWQGVSGTNRNEASDWKIQLKNIEASLEAVETAHKMGISSFITTGSIHEAEIQQEILKGIVITDPVNMYKSAKTASHWMCKAKAGEYGIRFFNPLIIGAYGVGDKPDSLINMLIKQIFENTSPSLSPCEHMYDFVYISDIAHALYLIAEKAMNGKEYIIGSGTAKPLKDFLTIAGDMANAAKGGEKIPLGFGKYKGKAVYLPPEAFDTTSLTEDTGFMPQISFEDGIKRTIDCILKERIIL